MHYVKPNHPRMSMLPVDLVANTLLPVDLVANTPSNRDAARSAKLPSGDSTRALGRGAAAPRSLTSPVHSGRERGRLAPSHPVILMRPYTCPRSKHPHSAHHSPREQNGSQHIG